jgi:hypothetical protein
MSSKKPETVTESGTERFIPLNKLKKSPKNARKTPHSEASIEAYAASIAAKGILQNLVVEPEVDADAPATGFYFVTIGKGRTLAQLLRVKRKEIKKTEPIVASSTRRTIPTRSASTKTSPEKHASRRPVPGVQETGGERGFGAEEIAARFGVTPHVVRQRLRLGAVSPKLMEIYRKGDLALDQLMAFAIVEDQARHEAAYERLSYSRDASTIPRMLTETHVAATVAARSLPVLKDIPRSVVRCCAISSPRSWRLFRGRGTSGYAGLGETRARGRRTDGGGRLEMGASFPGLPPQPRAAPTLPARRGFVVGRSGRPRRAQHGKAYGIYISRQKIFVKSGRSGNHKSS